MFITIFIFSGHGISIQNIIPLLKKEIEKWFGFVWFYRISWVFNVKSS